MLCILVYVYSVNHVLLLCSGEREVPIYVFSDQFIFQVSTMLPVILEEVFVEVNYPSSFSGLPTVQFLIVCSTIKNWTVGRPRNKASCSPRLLYSGGREKFSLGMRLGLCD